MKVLIIGAGYRSNWLASVLGQCCIDVERRPVLGSIVGKKPDLALLDELADDFDDALAMGTTLHQIFADSEGKIHRERIPAEKMFLWDGRHIDHDFTTGIDGRYDMVRAFTPEEKRKQPKGPRGRWGKLK